MLNRVLEIFEENRFLSLSRGFILIKDSDSVLATVPLSDVGLLLISAQSTCLSKNILNALAEQGCVTVLCGKNYTPSSMVVPLYSNYLFAKILKLQIEASLPLKKRIWQQIVIKKLLNQALVLKIFGKTSGSNELIRAASLVKSGDSDNREACGAKIYWKELFGQDFVRDKNGEGINALLNYGYAVMRASMARAICARGLLASLGVHHDNNLNQFCLADDFFEIYRPIIDYHVYRLVEAGKNEITPETKKYMISSLWIKMDTCQGCSPVSQSMLYMVSSYIDCLETKKSDIKLPEIGLENEDFARIK